MPTVVIADDHRLFREALTARLQLEPNLEVVAGTGNVDEVPELVQEVGADVLVLDLDMPGSPLSVAREVTHRTPDVALVALLPFPSDNLIAHCIEAGLCAVLLKTCTADCLIQAIDMARTGQRYWPPELRERGEEIERCIKAGGARQRTGPLTPREVDVLRLLAQGQSLKQVARSLWVSYKTVDSHAYNAMRKLNLRNRAELIHYALRENLVSIETLGSPDSPVEVN